MTSLRWMEAYTEDCKKDPVLQSFNDKCITCFDAVMRTKGDGHGGIQVDQLKEVVSFVCKMNEGITAQIINYEDEVVKLMAGEEECLKFVDQYFNTTSEMLAFCTELDRFVVSARDSHSYIAHVIKKLQTDLEKEATDDDDRLKNRFKRIVEELKKLKGSHMVSRSDSAESLLRTINGLQKKFDDMFKALKEYDLKLQEKQQANRDWKRIINMIFIGTIVCAGVLSLLAAAALVAGPAALVLAANPHTLLCTAVVLSSWLPFLGWGNHWASNMFDEAEEKITNQHVVVDLMKNGAQVAIKELGDIKHLIDSLLVHIDSMVENGEFGKNPMEVYSASFAKVAIDDKLGTFKEKIEELEKEQKRCTLEIRRARDDVLAKLTGKVEVVKKGKQWRSLPERLRWLRKENKHRSL